MKKKLFIDFRTLRGLRITSIETFNFISNSIKKIFPKRERKTISTDYFLFIYSPLMNKTSSGEHYLKSVNRTHSWKKFASNGISFFIFYRAKYQLRLRRKYCWEMFSSKRVIFICLLFSLLFFYSFIFRTKKK